MLRVVYIGAPLLVTLACVGGGQSAIEPSAEGSAETDRGTEAVEVEAALLKGSVLLEGEFAYETELGSHRVELGLRFSDGEITRLTQGSPTAVEPYRVVNDETGRAVIEISAEGQPPKRRGFAFDGSDTLYDLAAPEVRYRRIAHGDDADSTPQGDPR